MKFTFSWLKDHLETTATLSEIKATLDTIGLEVESIDDPSDKLGAFTIARVLEAKRHPNADKLQVLQVEIGPSKLPVEVVCGAPNARAGLIGVFAPLGSYIPGTGITLEKKPVRGVVSNGMMLSEREMELSEDHAGILDLAPDLAGRVGERYVDVMGLGDAVIEVKLTPNRPDCTGVRGIARDLAAAGLGQLKADKPIQGVEGAYESPVDIVLEFDAASADACPCFAGRYVRGVKNGPSPTWLRKRLEAVGQRSINAIVDVTNYISIDRGRPLHVYDADKVIGAIRARLANNGESFEGLDGREHTTDNTMCVIADERSVLGFGGILGGVASSTTESTKNILIECAYFDPVRTAATGRRAGIQTEARYRFERGVDPDYILPGLDLATRMMLDVAGGTPSKRKVAGKPPVHPFTVQFSFDRVEKLMGLKLPDAEIRRTLEALGFAITGKGPSYEVTAPTWRPDVHGSADLVEEIARIASLESIPSVPLPRIGSGVTGATLTETQRRVRRARRALASRGMVEAVTWSFIGGDEATLFGGGSEALQLANPISSEMTTMRPSLLPGLLAAVERNRNRGFADAALFEVGQVYRGDSAEDQTVAAAGVRAGTARLEASGRRWDGVSEPVDAFAAKADAVALLASLGFDASKAQVARDAPAWFHPGRSGTFRLGPKVVLGHFGELSPATLKQLDMVGPIVAFEMYPANLPSERRKGRARPPFDATDLLVVKRDFAFVLDRDVLAGEVVRAAQGADRALISSVEVFDVFEGNSLGAGKKSLAIEVTLAPKLKTLTDEEIEAVGKKVIAAVGKATGGEIRG